MRNRLGLVLLLFLLFAARGQARVDYEYWFDNDRTTLQSGTSDTAILQLELDVANLSPSLHFLHIQVMDSEGVRCAVVTRYFVKTIATADAMTGCYWFDNDYSTAQNASVTNGTFEVDLNNMRDGLHTFHYQAVGAPGTLSPVSSVMFFKSSEATLGDMKMHYYVDGDTLNISEGVRTGDTYQFDLDMNKLADGLHTLAYFFVDEKDMRSRVYGTYFWKNNRYTAPVTKYYYWLNGKEEERDSVNVKHPTDPFTLITMLPIAPQPIRSSRFTFAVEDGQPVVYAKNDITLRFTNLAGLSDETSASFTDINVREKVTDVTLLTPGSSHTATKPAENAIQWYKVAGLTGDSLAFKLSTTATMQLFSPTGEELFNVQGADVLSYKTAFAPVDGTYYVAVHDATDSSVQQITIDYRQISADGLIHVTGIEVISPIEMNVGDEINLSDYISVLPVDADNKKVEVVSNNEEIVTVANSDEGLSKIPLQTTDEAAPGYLWTNAQEPTEGPIANLIDGDVNTYFHTAWSVASEDPHYLAINLGEGKRIKDFVFSYTRRMENNNNRPMEIVIAGSNDGEDWDDFRTLTYEGDGLPCTIGDDNYTSAIIEANLEYQYLRFTVTLTNNVARSSSSNSLFFTFSEFCIYRILSDEKVLKANNPGETTLSLTSMDNPSITAEISVKVKSPIIGLSFANPQQTVYQGENINISWSPTPVNATDFEVKLNYDQTVFEVNQNESSMLVVKEDAAVGNHFIIANAYDPNGNSLGISDTLTVTVRAHVREIKVTSPLNLIAGETTDLSTLITVLPADAHDKSYTVSSDNEEVVTVGVDEEGVWTATGIRVGEATLTVTSVDNPSATAEMQVTVSVAGLVEPLQDELAQLKGETDELMQRQYVSLANLAVMEEEMSRSFLARQDTLSAMLGCFTFDTPATHVRYEEELAQDTILTQQMADSYNGLLAETKALKESILALTAMVDHLNEQLAQVATKEEADELKTLIQEAQENQETISQRTALLDYNVENLRQQVQEQNARLTALKAELVANVEGMAPHYALTLEHLSHLGIYPKLRYLDLSGAAIEGNALPDGVFSNLGLVSVALPASLTSVGSGLFAGCERLSAIVWNNPAEVLESTLSGIGNPNLLLYVNDYSQAIRSGVRNIVSGGLAQRITLTDNMGEDGTRGPSGFYVPQAFRVQNDISYTHTYTQQTAKGGCRGWETIALPFDVQTITHAVNGEAVPFAAYTSSGKRPFWLCRLTEDGFVDADCIEANTPYIISMPNNPQYSPFYCLNGEVTFSARGVTVPATELHPSSRGGASFIPTFERVPASPSVYALNVGGERWGYAEGSLFDRDYRDVHPFEAYRTTPQQGVPYMAVGDELRGATDITSPRPSPEGTGEGLLFDLSGRRFIGRPAEKGVYIRNGKKIVVR